MGTKSFCKCFFMHVFAFLSAQIVSPKQISPLTIIIVKQIDKCLFLTKPIWFSYIKKNQGCLLLLSHQFLFILWCHTKLITVVFHMIFNFLIFGTEGKRCKYSIWKRKKIKKKNRWKNVSNEFWSRSACKMLDKLA